MFIYQKTNYAINKNKEGIVYLSQDGNYLEITLRDYLNENPDKTEADFIRLKEFSDEIYLNEDRNDIKYMKRKLSLSSEKTQLMVEVKHNLDYSIEEELLRKEEIIHIRKAAEELFQIGNLTEVQKRRFIAHFIEGKSYRVIAESEHVHFTAIQQSISLSLKKIKNIYEKM